MTRRLAALALLAALGVLLAGATALAHGKPTIRVEPPVVPAGGAITVIGTGMDDGEEFAITLERAGRAVALGTATAKGEEEAGFSVTLAIPADTVPGSYVVRGAARDGMSAVADLTVTEPSASASVGRAVRREASGELHELDRPKAAAELAGAAALAVAVAGVGIWLVRARG